MAYIHVKNDAYSRIYNESLSATDTTSTIILDNTTNTITPLTDWEIYEYHLTITDGIRKEIVTVIGVGEDSGRDTVTVLRGQEGTTKLAWEQYDKIKINVTAEVINSVVDQVATYDADSTSQWTRIIAAEADIDALESSVGVNTSDISTLDINVTQLQTVAGTTQYNSHTHRYWIEQFDGEISNLDSTQEMLITAVNQLILDMSSYPGNETLQNDRLNALENRMTDAEVDIVNIDNNTDNLETYVSTYMNDLSDIQTDVSDLQTRADNVDTTMAGIFEILDDHLTPGPGQYSHSWAQIDKSASSINDLTNKTYGYLTDTPPDDDWGVNCDRISEADTTCDFVVYHRDTGTYYKVSAEGAMVGHFHEWDDLPRNGQGVIPGSSIGHLADKGWDHLLDSGVIPNSSLADIETREYSDLQNPPDDDDFHNNLDMITTPALNDEILIYDYSSHSYKRITKEDLLGDSAFDGKWTSLDFTGASLCHIKLDGKIPEGVEFSEDTDFECLINIPEQIYFGVDDTEMQRLIWTASDDRLSIYDYSSDSYKYIRRADLVKTSFVVGSIDNTLTEDQAHVQNEWIEVISKTGSNRFSAIALSTGAEGDTTVSGGVIYTLTGDVRIGIRTAQEPLNGITDTSTFSDAVIISSTGNTEVTGTLTVDGRMLRIGGNTESTAIPTFRVCSISGIGEVDDSGSGALMLSSSGTAADHQLIAQKVWNSVYNDLADFQQLAPGQEVLYGHCYSSGLNGMYKCYTRCEEGVAGICSDTFGYGMGIDNTKRQIPIALAGWVLAYVDKTYNPGVVLTNDKDGKLTKMSFFEKLLHPERIVAIYVRPEKEKTWGPNNIQVNGRHWVKVK